MLTLRALPPRLFAAERERAPHDLAGFYFDQLRRHWGPLDRLGAFALAGAGAIANLGALRGCGPAWRHGWDLREQALLIEGVDPRAHLSMAARKGVHRLINPGAFPLRANPLKNKRLFAERCRVEGLPTPAAFEGAPDAIGRWLAQESAIVAKPSFSSKGDGVVGYRRSGEDWTFAGGQVSEGGLIDQLREVMKRGGVVQRACETHPDLVAVSPGALPTLRIMTAVDEAGEIVALDRTIRLSAGGPRAVDNFNAGNIVAGVEEAGRIVPGHRRLDGGIVAVERHPTTGVALAGWPVPDIEAALSLARRAHEAFRRGFAVIGWDVGLTASGPCLIEGNWSPGTDILALVSGRGLGETRLGVLYRHHLAQLSRAEWRAARPIQWDTRGARDAGRPSFTPPADDAVAKVGGD